MIILYGLLAIAAGVLGVLTARAVWVRVRARKLTAPVVHEDASRQRFYAERLARMIRCRTVSIEGEYHPEEFQKIHTVMEDLFPLVHQKAEKMIFSDDCWIYRLQGKNPDRNIMLMSHHDVVAADGAWKYPPFDGVIAENALRGRGTVDTKTPLFAEFSALEELLETGWEPPVNVWIGSSHNEELGGDGIPRARDYFLEQGIRFELILDEGGAVISAPLPGMKCHCAMMAMHELGNCTIRCRAEASSGHAGLSRCDGTATERMSRFLTDARQDGVFARSMNPCVRAMFESLCPDLPFPLRLVFANLWCLERPLVKLIPKLNESAGSMLGTTCSFRGIRGGTVGGDCWEDCEAKAILWYISDTDLEKDLTRLRRIAEQYGVTLEVTQSEYHLPANLRSPGYLFARRTAQEMFPGAAVAPFILPAGTDARHLLDVSDAVVRFAPIEINDQQYGSVHGDDENISLPAIGNAVAFYRQLLKTYPADRF